jgi:DNA-binding response OmpR family regulator
MSYSLLIADDDSNYRKLIFNYFEERDFEITILSNGEKVLKALLNNNVDFAIIDYNLPELSGNEILDRLSAYDIETSIIVITEDSSPEIEQEIRKFSPDFLFVKPFNIEDLGSVIENIIRTKHAIKKFVY